MEKTVYSGNYIQVKELNIDNYTWEKGYFPDSLVVFPVTDNDEIIMIQEKRPHEGKNKVRLKFVTGHIEPNEDPAECANREMQEEIGFKANNIQEVLVHKSRGTINSDFYYFIAKDLEESKIPNPDGEDTIVGIKRIHIEKIMQMLEDGELDWTLSTLGLLKFLNQRKKKS